MTNYNPPTTARTPRGLFQGRSRKSIENFLVGPISLWTSFLGFLRRPGTEIGWKRPCRFSSTLWVTRLSGQRGSETVGVVIAHRSHSVCAIGREDVTRSFKVKEIGHQVFPFTKSLFLFSITELWVRGSLVLGTRISSEGFPGISRILFTCGRSTGQGPPVSRSGPGLCVRLRHCSSVITSLRSYSSTRVTSQHTYFWLSLVFLGLSLDWLCCPGYHFERLYDASGLSGLGNCCSWILSVPGRSSFREGTRRVEGNDFFTTAPQLCTSGIFQTFPWVHPQRPFPYRDRSSRCRVHNHQE